MPPRFYADENFPVLASEALKSRGVDILTVQEARMVGKSDQRQLVFSKRNRPPPVTDRWDTRFARVGSFGALGNEVSGAQKATLS